MPTSAPAVPAPIPTLLSCSDIAKRIGRKRGRCHRVSVWRVVQRLKLTPAYKTKTGGFEFFTEEQALVIAAAMRKGNRNVSGK